MFFRTASLFAIALLPCAVHAQDRDYCPDRPGLSTPPCTMAPGKSSLEVALGDWTLESDATQRQDVFATGDVLIRYGIADHAELQASWATLGFARTLDRQSGTVSHSSGTGDITLALRRNVANPDGSGFSIAVMPFVTLPVGRQPFGAGDWSTGVLLPVSYELTDAISLIGTTEIDAAVDEDGQGRHFAGSQTVGLSGKLGKQMMLTAEYQMVADHDPDGHQVQHLTGLSLGWQPADDLQLDLGANLGLDDDAPQAEVYLGVSRRF